MLRVYACLCLALTSCLFCCSAGSATKRKRKRKRVRSATPSESGDGLRSPLAKRKKLAAERSGASKLKEAISADDLAEVPGPVLPAEEEPGKRSAVGTPRPEEENVNGEEEDDEDEEEESEAPDDDEDDFLARELGEDWG